MWLFMTDSFLSIAADPEDADSLLVRARKDGDIERVFPDAIVVETPDADYRYTAPLPRLQVAAAIAEQIASMDYGDFQAALPPGLRRDAYLEVWWRMAGWQWQEAIGSRSRTVREEVAV